jgi:RNA polymerase sigma factor (sigma-70 family)
MMLKWLDADADSAGKKYEMIRHRLIQIFYARGCHFAEDLADETINRVIAQIESINGNYQGNPALYFYGVAKKVFLENSRKPVFTELKDNMPQSFTDTQEKEMNDHCLEKCLGKLDFDKREFILAYYENDKQAKIDQRRDMQKDLEISSQNLRLRAFRIRNKLQKCVFRCIEENFGETF